MACTSGSLKVSGILWHRLFGAWWIHTVWTKCYWSILRASFAEIARRSSEEAARQMAGTVVSASR
jgi:hypothetical protein